MSTQERIDQHRSYLRAKFAGNPRKCSQCREEKPAAGGRKLVFNRGMNERWICADCGHGDTHGSTA